MSLQLKANIDQAQMKKNVAYKLKCVDVDRIVSVEVVNQIKIDFYISFLKLFILLWRRVKGILHSLSFVE